MGSSAINKSNFAAVDLQISGQVQGDLLYFNGSDWIRLPAGSSGQHLRANGASANPSWETSPLPTDLSIASQATGNILYFNGTNWVRLAQGSSGQLLQCNGAAAPTWVAAPSGGSQIQVFTSSGTFTAPAGVTMVFITATAGGGGGGANNTSGGVAPGGGGGAAVIMRPYTVTPSNSYTVTVGAGGTAGSRYSIGGTGGTTSFDGTGISLPGGTGGIEYGGPTIGVGGGEGLNAETRIGGYCIKGGNALGTDKGGGGASAIGKAGSRPSGAGAGSAGVFGGGGGGAYGGGVGFYAGGAGGAGIVIVTY